MGEPTMHNDHVSVGGIGSTAAGARAVPSPRDGGLLVLGGLSVENADQCNSGSLVKVTPQLADRRWVAPFGWAGILALLRPE